MSDTEARVDVLVELKDQLANLQAVGEQYGRRLTATVDAHVLVELLQRVEAAERERDELLDMLRHVLEGISSFKLVSHIDRKRTVIRGEIDTEWVHRAQAATRAATDTPRAGA